MSKGWIKLHRSMFDNDLWTAEPFTKGQAWIDLIGHANHRPASIWVRGIEVSIERGQLAWSELTMSERWKWSRGKVRRYLGMLRDRGMVVQQTNKVTTILTICKYETYQAEQTAYETTDSTTGRTTDGQQTDNRRYTNKNVKKNKNDENKDIGAGALDYSVWPALPSDQVFDDWLKMRKRKKANVTQTVINKFAKQLEIAQGRGLSVDDCLSECIVRNWTGFQADWVKAPAGKVEDPTKSKVNDHEYNELKKFLRTCG